MLYSTAIAISLLLADPSQGINLEEAIITALENRSEITSSEMNLRTAELTELDSDLWFLPSISVMGNIGAAGDESPSPDVYSSGVALSGQMQIFSLQGIAGSRISSTETEISKTALSAAEMDIIKDTAISYLDVLYSIYVLETSEMQLEIQEEAFRTAGLNYRAGTISRYDYLQSHVTLENSRPEYRAALFDYENAVNALSVAMGIDPDFIPHLNGSLEQSLPFNLPSSLVQARLLMEMNSTELRLSELSVESAENMSFMANAVFAPTVSATANLGWSGQDEDFGGIDTERWVENWSVGLEVSIPLFTGLDNIISSRSAGYSEVSVIASHNAVVDLLEQQLNEAWNGCLLAMDNLSGADVLIEEAEEALSIAYVSYDGGSITALNLDNSVVALMQARDTRSRALLNLRIYQTTIARLTGTLSINEGRTR